LKKRLSENYIDIQEFQDAI